jgi:hypothetical protein
MRHSASKLTTEVEEVLEDKEHEDLWGHGLDAGQRNLVGRHAEALNDRVE